MTESEALDLMDEGGMERTAETAAETVAETAAASAAPDPRFAHNIALITRAREGDEAAMERLVLDNMGLVRTVAVRFRDRGTEFEDLLQIGTMGMIKAIHSFDVGRGTAFSTYAVPLIVGEIRRHLRDDGLIRVSRGTRHTGLLLMRARARISAEEGREAGVAELAAAVGISVEEAAVALEAMTPVSSLSDNAYGEDSPELGDVIPDRSEADDMARSMDKIALAQVISRLPPDWRKIILLRYYRDMTQQQVADVMGLTQVKVSREEKKIMAYMREQLS